MWSLKEAGFVSPDFRLSLNDHSVSHGSIECSQEGTTFACTIGPLSLATMADLQQVADAQGRVCLYCCREPLLVELVTLERKGVRSVRIVGHVVESDSASKRPAEIGN